MQAKGLERSFPPSSPHCNSLLYFAVYVSEPARMDGVGLGISSLLSMLCTHPGQNVAHCWPSTPRLKRRHACLPF